MKSKAQSQVIGAVILILIVLTLAIIILNLSTGFVEDKLEDTGCFKVITSNAVFFTDNFEYNCFDSVNGEVKVQVQVGDVESLEGLLIDVGGASTTSVEIIEGISLSNVRMINGNYNEPLVLPPERNSARTYVIKSDSVESARIYALISEGNLCDLSDNIEVRECS